MKNNQSPPQHILRKLLSTVFLFVFGSTLGIIFCINYTTFSVNLHISRLHVSPELPSETSPSPSTVSTLRSSVSPSIPPIMSDEELLRRASEKRELGFRRETKVAFMFLTRGAVVLAPLWEKFFKGYRNLFSVYVHSDPSFNESESEFGSSSVFFRRRIYSKKVQWGNINMVEAERRLLANALLDVSNEYFILLSESCIPLYNFSTIYKYLLNSTQTFVEVKDIPGPVGRGRYSPRMSPTIRASDWRKGSQWFAVDRRLAVEIVSDEVYFSVFQRYCKDPCYADEHYLPTFVSMKFGARNANRTLTWVDWSRGGRHPSRFVRPHVTPEFLERLRTAARCEYNGRETDVCHFFARKFTDHALGRLLRFAPRVMHFDR